MPLDIRVEPRAIGWHAVVGIEAHAAEHMRVDFAAFLRRRRVEWMEVAELRCQELEHTQAACDRRDPTVRGARPQPKLGVRVNCLPDQRCAVARVGHHQPMQKGRTAAGKAGDEDGLADMFPQNAAIVQFGGAHAQQVDEEAGDIPSGRGFTDQTQRGFLRTRREERAQRFQKAFVAEIG